MLPNKSVKEKGLIFVSGPSNSGKSLWAEKILSDYINVIYIATASFKGNDDEWSNKVNKHRERRPLSWGLIESPSNIIKSINDAPASYPLLIDSIGGLVEAKLDSNEPDWLSYTEELLTCLLNAKNLIVIVNEETGWSIVPATKIGHRFRERITTLSSEISHIASERWLVINQMAVRLDDIACSVK